MWILIICVRLLMSFHFPQRYSKIFKTVWKVTKTTAFLTFYLCWWIDNISSVDIFSSTECRINTLSWVTYDPRYMRSYRLKLDDRVNGVGNLKVMLECNSYLDYLDWNFSYLVFSINEKPETWKEKTTESIGKPKVGRSGKPQGWLRSTTEVWRKGGTYDF